MERRPVARPLTICARSSETTESQSSLEVNVSEHSVEWDQDQLLLGELQQVRSLAATPPPEGGLVSNQLVDGIGCHFPAVLPTRYSSLTLGNESVTDAPATPHNVPETTDTADVCCEVARGEDDLNTPGPTTPFFETPTQPAPCKRMFGPANPLTPSPTPKRKRNPSPPFAPCPAKRQRIRELETGEELEVECHPNADCQEPAANQALCTIRQLTISLAGSTGHAVDNPAGEFSRDGTSSRFAGNDTNPD